MMQISITIHEPNIGLRLDQVIADQVPGCSRKTASQAASDGRILVDGRSRKPGYRLKSGERLTGEICMHTDQIQPEAEPVPLEIIYQDALLMVINKPAGMVVHPGAGNDSGTLVNGLLYHDPGIAAVGDPGRPGIVHRLDKETSGLIVTARTQKALAFLQKEFKYRRVEKRYLAMVHGKFSQNRGRINLPIGRHPVRRKMMAVRQSDGRPAVTEWRLLAQYPETALVEAHIKTGRTHQIRVHFYDAGFPLVGDAVYQPRRFRKKRDPAGRQMLHSWKLSFRHPYSGRRLKFMAEIPPDFKQCLSVI